MAHLEPCRSSNCPGRWGELGPRSRAGERDWECSSTGVGGPDLWVPSPGLGSAHPGVPGARPTLLAAQALLDVRVWPQPSGRGAREGKAHLSLRAGLAGAPVTVPHLPRARARCQEQGHVAPSRAGGPRRHGHEVPPGFGLSGILPPGPSSAGPTWLQGSPSGPREGGPARGPGDRPGVNTEGDGPAPRRPRPGPWALLPGEYLQNTSGGACCLKIESHYEQTRVCAPLGTAGTARWPSLCATLLPCPAPSSYPPLEGWGPGPVGPCYPLMLSTHPTGSGHHSSLSAEDTGYLGAGLSPKQEARRP